jgi:hypothetical protein
MPTPSYIATADGKVYEDEFALTLGRPMPDPWDEKDEYKPVDNMAKEEPSRNIFLPITENKPIEEELPNSFEVAAARQKASVRPREGRGEGGTTKVLSEYVPHAIKQMATLPERVTQASETMRTTGVYDPGPAVETAIALYGANAPFIKPGSLGIFGGTLAKNVDRAKLNEAQLLEGRGEHPVSIFQRTGWYRGNEGRWKFEIPDQGAKLKQEVVPELIWTKDAKTGEVSAVASGKEYLDTVDPSRIKRMDDLLDHPKLYEAYPWVKDIKIKVVDDPHFSGSANFEERRISINQNQFDDPAELMKTLLHEIQHMIQGREGFAKGANYVREGEFKHDWHNEIDDKLFEASRLWEEAHIELGREPTLADFTPKERELIKKADRLNEIYKEMQKIAPELAENNYMKTAGEVEARNVERRSEQPAHFNKLVPPSKTEIFPSSKQIINKDPVFYAPYGPGGEGR